MRLNDLTQSSNEQGHFAFEDAHKWSGDKLHEAESEAFQQGKYKALQKLVPYTSSGSKEAAAVVLKGDGSEFHFNVGAEDEVTSLIPANLPVAHLHTHSQEGAHSEGDWPGFLATPGIEQAHVVTPAATYSLHKPVGWNGLQHDLSAAAIVDNYTGHFTKAYKVKPNYSLANETWWREEANRRMARQYGVNFRIGKRGDLT